MRLNSGLLLGVGVLAATAVWASDLTGTIAYRAKKKGSVSSLAEAAHTVVFFRPERSAAVRPNAEVLEIVMARKQFEPRVSAVPLGSRVRFPNRDPILHNVFSVTSTNPFDLGLYGEGPGEAVALENPGLVRVFCNVHHDMVAHIWVLDTSFSTRPDQDGRFVLRDLPVGTGELTVWHERAEPLVQRLTLPNDGELALELLLEKPRVPRHRNKLGQRYTKKRDRDYP